MRDAALAGRVVAGAAYGRALREGTEPVPVPARVLQVHRRAVPETPPLEHREQGGRVGGVGELLRKRGGRLAGLGGGDGEAGERKEEGEGERSHGRGEVGVDLGWEHWGGRPLLGVLG